MPSDSSTIKEPTFVGFVDSTYDALLLFEACLRQRVRKITRRLHEKERHLINSGSVFVFDERESGIKRWTDNLFWSPSRILGNFLIYRELDKKDSNAASSTASEAAAPDEAAPAMLGNSDPSLRGGDPSTAISRERSLLGSLTSSYKFKANGLVKKTISVSGMHMICYYRVNDVVAGKLRNPSSLPEIASLDISPSLLTNQTFRVPPKVEIGPDGKTRYAGEVDESGSGSHSLPLPGSNSRRRSASSERPLPARYSLPMELPADDAATRPVRPSAPRSNSNSSAKRYDPYSRSSIDQQATPGQAYSLPANLPINFQEMTARRRSSRSSPTWSPAHINTDLPQVSSHPPSVPSPAESSSSGGGGNGGAYETSYSPYGVMTQSGRPSAYQQAFEDPMTAFRQYQAGHPQLAKNPQFRTVPPLQVFPLPPDNYRHYYGQPHSPHSFAPDLPVEGTVSQEDAQYAAMRRGSYELPGIASTGVASASNYAPVPYGYRPVASPTSHHLSLPYAPELAQVQYQPSGLVAPSPDPAGFSPTSDRPQPGFDDWHHAAHTAAQ